MVKKEHFKIQVCSSSKYVPDLKRNILSIGMMDKDGYIIKIDKGIIKVYKSVMVIMKGLLSIDLYSLIGNIVLGYATLVIDTEQDHTKLYHLRIGHISDRGLAKLGK